MTAPPNVKAMGFIREQEELDYLFQLRANCLSVGNTVMATRLEKTIHVFANICSNLFHRGPSM